VDEVLAQKAENLQAALDDEHSDWIYARFIPTAASGSTPGRATAASRRADWSIAR
jgi:hypothetical protein